MIIHNLGPRIAILCATTLVSACSSSTSTPTGGTGGASEAGVGAGGAAAGGSTGSSSGGATASGGTTSGAGGSATDAGSACNTITNAGPAVPRTPNAGEFTDTLTGGTIADGTYQLTAWTEYGTSSTASTTNKETYVITGNAIRGVTTPNGAGEPELHFTATFTTSGNLFTVNLTCPGAITLGPWQFQVTAAGYEAYDTQNKRLTVFTRLH